MISGHPYQQNGLGARDENGNITCRQCGLTEGAHSTAPLRDLQTPDHDPHVKPALEEGGRR